MLATAAPPSRHDNPFATCWTRPGALPCLPMAGVSVEQLLERWRAAGGHGQVVGRHGVGKSTLLRAAGERLAVEGELVRSALFRADGSRTLPSRLPGGGVLLVDGLEQLGWLSRSRLLSRCRRRGVRVLASTHRPLRGLPVLAEVEPTESLMRVLFDRLTAERPTPVTADEAALAFAECGGNLRELWFRLYDQHESAVRGELSGAGSSS